MSEIDLLLDEDNELSFQLSIEGSQPGTARCRLTIENNDLGLLFESSKIKNDEVTFTLPPLKHVLSEGSYDMKLEVIVDDKFFTPLTLTGNFERRISVTAESVVRKPKRTEPRVTSASLVSSTAKKRSVLKESSINREVEKESKRNLSDKEIMNLISALASKNKGS
jgi:hypothetical protein